MNRGAFVKGVLMALAAMALGWVASKTVASALVMTLLAQSCFYALFALGVGLLIRQNGMVSFGHAAFFGLPGYLIGIGLKQTDIPIELLIPLVVLAVTTFAFLVGLVFVRVHGIAFGMLTLAIGQAVYEASTRLRGLTGGHDGLTIKFPRELFGLPLKTFQQPHGMFLIAWCVLVIVVTLVIWLAHSRLGRLTEAIRENEERAGFLGYRTLWPRAVIFAISAATTAAGGVLFALYNAYISPETVYWTSSGSALIMAVLGGSVAPWGPVLGSMVYFFLKEALGDVTTHWLGIIGISLIVVTVSFPQGLSGLAMRLLGLGARRRHADS